MTTLFNIFCVFFCLFCRIDFVIDRELLSYNVSVLQDCCFAILLDSCIIHSIWEFNFGRISPESSKTTCGNKALKCRTVMIYDFFLQMLKFTDESLNFKKYLCWKKEHNLSLTNKKHILWHLHWKWNFVITFLKDFFLTE